MSYDKIGTMTDQEMYEHAKRYQALGESGQRKPRWARILRAADLCVKVGSNAHKAGCTATLVIAGVLIELVQELDQERADAEHKAAIAQRQQVAHEMTAAIEQVRNRSIPR